MGVVSVEAIYAARKEDIVQAWTSAIFALYPFETTGFLRTQKDRFANPVGHATMVAADTLYDAVTGRPVDDDQVRLALAELIRIRAIQDLTPDQAVGALFLLKPAMRKHLLTDALAEGALEEYLDAESRVDSLALMAFDLYMADKQAVFKGRVAELRRRYSQIERWVAAQGASDLFPDPIMQAAGDSTPDKP